MGEKRAQYPLCVSDFLWIFTRPPTMSGGGLGYTEEAFMRMNLRRMETLLRKADEKKGGPVPYPEVARLEAEARYEEAHRDGEDLRRSLEKSRNNA